MSVLIRGMEMPTSCGDCRLMADGWCYSVWLEQREKISTVKRPTWCPLVPVPKHGDLIDRDKFRSTVFIGEQWLYSWDELEDAIDYAPTIIPADPADPAKEGE